MTFQNLVCSLSITVKKGQVKLFFGKITTNKVINFTTNKVILFQKG